MLGFPKLIQPCKKIEIETVAKRQPELFDSQGFNSYQEIKLWLLYTNLDDVKYQVAEILNSLSEDIVHSLTGWQYILDALSL